MGLLKTRADVREERARGPVSEVERLARTGNRVIGFFKWYFGIIILIYLLAMFLGGAAHSAECPKCDSDVARQLELLRQQQQDQFDDLRQAREKQEWYRDLENMRRRQQEQIEQQQRNEDQFNERRRSLDRLNQDY